MQQWNVGGMEKLWIIHYTNESPADSRSAVTVSKMLLLVKQVFCKYTVYLSIHIL